MKKLLRLFANFTLSFMVLGVYFVSAHPLDVSNTTLTIYPDSIIGVTYLHPVELDRILVLSGGVDPDILSVETYYTMTGLKSPQNPTRIIPNFPLTEPSIA